MLGDAIRIDQHPRAGVEAERGRANAILRRGDIRPGDSGGYQREAEAARHGRRMSRYNVNCPRCGVARSLPDYGLWPDSAYAPTYPEPSEPQECLDCPAWMQVIPQVEVTVRECPNLAALAKAARVIASRVGTMHALWDTIHDAEEWCAGNTTLLAGNRNEVYFALVKIFQEAQVKAE